MSAQLSLVSMTRAEACAFVVKHHRHHKPSVGDVFCLGAQRGDDIVGVVVVGRPVARMLQDGWTLEVTRLCSDGTRNVCSFLYQAAWRAARALGWRRLVTYTLPEEGGGFTARGRLEADRRSGWRIVASRAQGASRYGVDATEVALGGD